MARTPEKDKGAGRRMNDFRPSKKARRGFQPSALEVRTGDVLSQQATPSRTLIGGNNSDYSQRFNTVRSRNTDLFTADNAPVPTDQKKVRTPRYNVGDYRTVTNPTERQGGQKLNVTSSQRNASVDNDPQSYSLPRATRDKLRVQGTLTPEDPGKVKERMTSEADARFAASLLDALDQKKERPDLEELEGRLAGIQDATAKLNRDIIGDKKTAGLRARAAKYQEEFEKQKVVEDTKPREAGATDFTRLEGQMAQFRKMVGSEEGLRFPNKVRARINELRKEVHALSTIPRATANPRYEALLQELNEGEASLAAMEGDELSQLLQAVGEVEQDLDQRDIRINPAGTTMRPDVTDAAMNRAQRVQDRLNEAYADSDARFHPSYGEIKQRVGAALNRVEALRNPVLSPRIEARAIVPERVVEEPTLINDADVEEVEQANSEPRMTHAQLIAPNRSIEWQVAEAEMQSSQHTAHILELQAKLDAAGTKEEQHALEAELVQVAHLQEVALKREFILLSAEPRQMAQSLDQAAETHTRLLEDEIGQDVIAKVRKLEDEGHLFDSDLIRSEFKDADEASYARKWLGVRRTSQMVENGITHLREYHEAQLNLVGLRDRLVTHCKTCFIPADVRAELEAASTPAERKQMVDGILADPGAMDKVQTVPQFLMAGLLLFNRAFKALGLPHSDREFSNKELDTLVKTLRREEYNVDDLHQGRMGFSGIVAPGAAREARAANDNYTLGDPLASPPETAGPFETLMGVSERAGNLIRDMRDFSGDVNDKVIARFNSRLRSMEDDVGAYTEAPGTVKSVYELAQAKLTDARHELARLQKKQEAPVAPETHVPAKNVSPDNLGLFEQNVSISREEVTELGRLGDNAEALLDQVNEALNEDRVMGDGEFQGIDREAIVLSARLRTMHHHQAFPAFQAADRAVKALNQALDRYEERTVAKNRENKNRPAEALFKSGVVEGLKEVAGNAPKRAALSHYLIELNGGEGVRLDRVDDVQDVLLTFLRRYPSMHTIEQRQAERSFAKVAELLNFAALYRDLGVTNLSQLTARLNAGIDLRQPPANERGDENSSEDEIEDLLAEFEGSGEPLDNTKLAA